MAIRKIESKATLSSILKYERDMFEQSFICTNKNISKNICLEVFLLHARNLIYFLEASSTNANDIVCTDFLDKNNKSIEGIGCNLGEDVKKAIHKHCMHMTKDRLKNKIQWNCIEIYNKITEGLKKFDNLLLNK